MTQGLLPRPRCSFVATLRADFQGFLALERIRPRSPGRYLDVLTQPGFMAVALFRTASLCSRAHLRPLARILYVLNVVLFGAELSHRAEVGPGLVIPHPVGVGIGAGVRLGRNVRLFKGVTLGTAGLDDPAKDGFPAVGDECMIMDGAKLLGPIEVGERAVIGANALVMRSIPAGAIVATGSGRVVRYREGYGPPGPGAETVKTSVRGLDS